MNLADELRKLQELHTTGALTDEEFAQAKAALLNAEPQAQRSASQDSSLFPIDPYDSLTPQRLFPHADHRRSAADERCRFPRACTAFFGCIAYLLEGQSLALAVVGVAIV